MKITIESTDTIIEVSNENGSGTIPARLWEGITESGIPVQCFITRIAASTGDDLAQFERELKQTRAPQLAWDAFPLRMIL